MSPQTARGHVPPIRVADCNDLPAGPKADYVLYWMGAMRRTGWNFGLERAVQWARDLAKPLVVVETLACGDRWASDRHHTFVLQGMADNAAACKRHGVGYYPYVESRPGEQVDLMVALSARACVLVGDDFPINSIRDGLERVARRVGVRMERVDSNGLLPLRAADRAFATAHGFRRFLQRTLPDHLLDAPQADPLAGAVLRPIGSLPREIGRRWPAAGSRLLRAEPAALAPYPIAHHVPAVEAVGGSATARRHLKAFVKRKLANYARDRNHPGIDATSGLSPYLHFGHISVHEIFRELARAEGWWPTSLADKATGRREGWWGMSPSAEAFLDELITWREVGLNMCAHRTDYDQYQSLPDWAQQTLADHAADARPHVYSLEEFETGRTHDRLWNAAQMQIVREGRMHNYLRMLWGKRILQWSASPRQALEVMVELNNKYGLDGQDPNSYSGILWVLGRYDHAWGPERPVFGKVRYMTSENTARKVRLGDYLDRHGA